MSDLGTKLRNVAVFNMVLGVVAAIIILFAGIISGGEVIIFAALLGSAAYGYASWQIYLLLAGVGEIVDNTEEIMSTLRNMQKTMPEKKDLDQTAAKMIAAVSAGVVQPGNTAAPAFRDELPEL